MSTPRFPRSPNIHQRPFEDGKNPFTDHEPLDDSANRDPNETAYVARVVDDSGKQEVDYEANLPNRSRTLVILGVIGALLSTLSVALAVLAISSADWVTGMLYEAPIGLVALAFSIPGWTMAHGDLRALRAGAMDPNARRGTRLAYWLGCLGTLLAFAPAAGGLVALFLAMFS